MEINALNLLKKAVYNNKQNFFLYYFFYKKRSMKKMNKFNYKSYQMLAKKLVIHCHMMMKASNY